jgi:hypothetical protein
MIDGVGREIFICPCEVVVHNPQAWTNIWEFLFSLLFLKITPVQIN